MSYHDRHADHDRPAGRDRDTGAQRARPEDGRRDDEQGDVHDAPGRDVQGGCRNRLLAGEPELLEVQHVEADPPDARRREAAREGGGQLHRRGPAQRQRSWRGPPVGDRSGGRGEHPEGGDDREPQPVGTPDRGRACVGEGGEPGSAVVTDPDGLRPDARSRWRRGARGRPAPSARATPRRPGARSSLDGRRAAGRPAPEPGQGAGARQPEPEADPCREQRHTRRDRDDPHRADVQHGEEDDAQAAWEVMEQQEQVALERRDPGTRRGRGEDRHRRGREQQQAEVRRPAAGGLS